ncbi:hypothetical protein [Nocardia callitridis]|uniref:hypothetical protein n=1 Tax=Nocardia callitridis TaxID=648753 RepID=UPI0031EAD6D2
MTDGDSGIVEEVFQERVVHPLDGAVPGEEAGYSAGGRGGAVAQFALVRAALEDLEGVRAFERSWREGEFDELAGLIGGAAVADRAVATVRAHSEWTAQDQWRPILARPQWVTRLGYLFEQSADAVGGNR